jgi:cell division protein DivIC
MRRVIVGFYLVLFLGLGLTSGAFFWQTRAEYNRLRQLEAQSQQRLTEAETRLREQEKILERLRTDRAYVEKVIRRQLHYARPDEFVFRFED